MSDDLKTLHLGIFIAIFTSRAERRLCLTVFENATSKLWRDRSYAVWPAKTFFARKASRNAAAQTDFEQLRRNSLGTRNKTAVGMDAGGRKGKSLLIRIRRKQN
jgi:hypothetical protein